LTNESEILQLVKKRENFSARNKKVPQAEAEKCIFKTTENPGPGDLWRSG
jgi:hypothetical protein